MLTVFGASAVSFMMLMYAMERRHNGFVLAFAAGCALSSAYGFLAGTWPFGAVEAIWALVALWRFAKPSPARTRAVKAGLPHIGMGPIGKSQPEQPGTTGQADSAANLEVEQQVPRRRGDVARQRQPR
jgi:hypothetical protein